MTTVSSQSADGVRWNLRELYDGPADPRIEADRAATAARAEAFATEWRGSLAATTAPGLRAALAEYEAIQQLAQRPGFYASLLTAMDSQDPVALALEQRNRITSSRSTVGTVTEVNDYLKLIWSNLSEAHCPKCGLRIEQVSAAKLAVRLHP